MLCSHCMHVLNTQLKWPHVTEYGGWKAACFRQQEFYTGIRRILSFCQWLIEGPIYSWTGIWCNNSLFWHILQSGYAVFNASCYISSAHGLTSCNINFAKGNDIIWHWLLKDTHYFFRSHTLYPWVPNSKIKLADKTGVNVQPQSSIFILSSFAHFYL